jgi:hypothetical protein
MFRSTDQGPVGVLPLDRGGALKAFNEPTASLVETKHTIVVADRLGAESAREAEYLDFARLMGQPSDLEASAALAGGGRPDFAGVDSEYPPDVEMHRSDIESN